MKTWMKHLYRDTDRGFALLSPFVRLREWLYHGGFLPARIKISRDFQQSFGRSLPWEAPATLNEKLNWLKLHGHRPIQTTLADKVAVRAHVAATIGEEYLVPCLGVYASPADIHLDALPSAVVLKVNHGSGQNLIIRDTRSADEAAIHRQLREWVATSHYTASREWVYRGIPPRIIAEALLTDEDGQIPKDYKFHCLNGKVAFIQVDLAREENHRRNFYSTSWELLPFLWTEIHDEKPAWPNGGAVERPEALEKMIHLAETLAGDLPYARIDLYFCRRRIYFGEYTFFHGAALEHFIPAEWDRTWGARLQLPPT